MKSEPPPSESPSEPPAASLRAANRAAQPGADRRQALTRDRLAGTVKRVEDTFRAEQRVLGFGEYLDLFASHPVRYGRSAVQYVRDLFGHYGTEQVRRPWGETTRFKLFDAPWRDPASPLQEPVLLGHEALQGALYRVLCNFAREGRANRLVLMHGPNGSAKSTAASCILRGLEAYSNEPEGALYRFHWIFPTRKQSRGAIGFGSGEPGEPLDTFAHLPDDAIDARLVMELRDHPLFLIPRRDRIPLIEALWGDLDGDEPPPRWLYEGDLSHKNRQIFEALLSNYGGSLAEVLRHVQVERYYMSRRYRVGVVTLGPEMAIDARERQLTADRSLGALPTSLQATTLFEAHGELVDAAGGVLEFSDLLKRPLDHFRYLQLTLETGQAALSQQTIFTNVVMIGSANDVHLAAFREHPEYPSFRGRLEPVVVPYLRHVGDEQAIYDTQIAAQMRDHVAPHATRVAAEFAVLTRLHKPKPERYPDGMKDIVSGLGAVDKMRLYAEGATPAGLDTDQRKLLRANAAALYAETETLTTYEGCVGASPRAMRGVLLDAAQNKEFDGLSPFAVLDELDALCKRKSDFQWLSLDVQEGGYHDHALFRKAIAERLFDAIEADLRFASGLVEEESYDDLFERYIANVSVWVKGEKIRNRVTGAYEDADEALMREVEGLLDVEGKPDSHRHTMISLIAAWAIDNPGQKPPHDEIFAPFVGKLRDAAFAKLQKPFAQLLRDIAALLLGSGGLDDKRRAAAREAIDRLAERGYNDDSARHAATNLLRTRFADEV